MQLARVLPQLRDGINNSRVWMSAGSGSLPLDVCGDNDREPKSWRRRDERRVKGFTGKTIADETHVKGRFSCSRHQ
jgi:hypothetical protein